MRAFHEVGELVELLAGVVGTSRHADTADIGSLVEDGEGAGLQHVHQFHELHAEAQVGLVAAETPHGLVPCHLLQLLRQVDVEDLLEEIAAHILEDANDILLVNETHLAVDLRELGLAVGAEVFVAEALRNLEVTVEAAHHEQLLQRLRTLWQGVELSGVHARRHHEVACAFGSRPNEDGGLHLDEVF